MKAGLAGAMIVYPRSEVLRPARELVVVQSAVYGVADSDGIIPGTDPTRARKNDPELVIGRLEHQPIEVAPHDLVRVYGSGILRFGRSRQARVSAVWADADVY